MLSPPSWSCKQGSDFGLVTLTPHSLGSRCLSKMRVTSLPAALHPAFAATQSGFSDTVLCLHRLRSFTGLSFQFHVRCVGGASANAPRSEGLDLSKIGPYYGRILGQATISDKDR